MARIKLRNARPRKKAFFGESLAAAGITAAATLASAGMQVAATKSAAQKQAEQMKASADHSASAIATAHENDNKARQDMLDAYKEQMAENRAATNDYQLAMQQAMGIQNQNNRLANAKLMAKYGTSTRKKNHNTSLLRGGKPNDFHITDGGGVIPIAEYPDGSILYEAIGNDHNHYHRTPWGKYETGVGLKTNDGSQVEVEGNQNGPVGEMILKPANGNQPLLIMSKHDIHNSNPQTIALNNSRSGKSYNPVADLFNGENPNVVFAKQELVKNANGISDDGRYVSPPIERNISCCGRAVRHLACGGRNKRPLGGINVLPTVYSNANNLSKNYNFAQDILNNYYNGLQTQLKNFHGIDSNILPKPQTLGEDIIVPHNANSDNANSELAAWLGSGISAIGNIGAAALTSIGNNKANNIINNARTYASNKLFDAYMSRGGIDNNYLKAADFRAAHMMPVMQAVMSNAQPAISLEDRALQRSIRNAGRYSASGATALNRMNLAETNAADARAKIYQQDNANQDQVRARNIQAANDAARYNMQADNEALNRYYQYFNDYTKYNNDIKNNNITQAAELRYNTDVANAMLTGQTASTNMNTLAGAINNIGTTFGNTANGLYKQSVDLNNFLIGSDASSVVNALTNGVKNDRAWAAALYNQYKSVNDPEYKLLANQLARRYNFPIIP